jgi:diketogulonate reductase-like aldo/keto reductase
MEQFAESGQLRLLGVSNFVVRDLWKAMAKHETGSSRVHSASPTEPPKRDFWNFT